MIRAKDAGSASTRQSGGLTERSTGSVRIPQEAFIAALRMGDEGLEPAPVRAHRRRTSETHDFVPVRDVHVNSLEFARQ